MDLNVENTNTKHFISNIEIGLKGHNWPVGNGVLAK